MVAYSFKRRFVRPIWTGDKPHTIRADRRRHARPGEELQLYYAMRTKQCRLILKAPCLSVEPITIRRGANPFIERAGREITNLDEFARLDGFSDFADMEAFWQAEHPEVTTFSGWIITWDLVRNTFRMPTIDWLDASKVAA